MMPARRFPNTKPHTHTYTCAGGRWFFISWTCTTTHHPLSKKGTLKAPHRRKMLCSRIGLQLGVVALQVCVIALTISSSSHLLDDRRPSIMVASVASTAAAVPSPPSIVSEPLPVSPPAQSPTARITRLPAAKSMVRNTSLPLIMLVGPPGSGHETLGLALMRLPDVLPMTLVQEQSFVHLWWANGGRATEADTPADPAVLASAAETLRDWARQASASGRRLAFGGRGCLRSTAEEGGDCSWISGMGTQLAPTRGEALLSGRALEWTGEPFAFPLGGDPAAEPGSQRPRYPRLGDLQALCAAAAPPLALRVLALRRTPFSTFAHAAAERPAPFWRPTGRPERLAHLATLVRDGGRRAAAQLQQLPPAMVRIVDVDALLKGISAGAAPGGAVDATVASAASEAINALGAFTGISSRRLLAALREAEAADAKALAHLSELLAAADGHLPSADETQQVLRDALAAAAADAAAAGWSGPAVTVDGQASGDGDDWERLVGPTASTPSGAVLAMARWQATAPTLATTAAVTAAAAAAAASAAAIAAPSANASDGAADVLFTHVLNPFFADSAEHKLAMRLTFASLAAAAATAEAQGVTVELLAAVLPRDKGVVRASLPATEQLLRAHSDGAHSDAAQLASGAALKALQAAVRSARNIREVELSASASLRTALPEVSHKIELPLLPDDR